MPVDIVLTMTTEELIADAMALPLAERVSLAQALWESIDAGLTDTDESAAVREAIQRDEELSSGKVTGRPHEEVIARSVKSAGIRLTRLL
jgi:putative addiction module component (TIGR02574 family)